VETGTARSPADMVAQARDGDEQAWNDLVARYLGMVHAICRGYHLTGDDAADVNQVVWLRLVEHLGRIRAPDAVGGWIAATARNECLRVLRAPDRRLAVDDHGGLDGPDTGIDAGLLVYERDRALLGAFARLDHRCQRVLRLLMAEPRPSDTEIAAALDLPVGAVRSAQGRCLDELRRELA
jgi:RNA polymerase sigma factor (sigma-70 family)